MGTISTDLAYKTGTQHHIVKVSDMDHGEESDVIEGAGWDFAYITAGPGTTNANPGTSASIAAYVTVDGTAISTIIAEDANNVRHLRTTITSGGVVTTGFLAGPLPTRFTVALNGATAADWDVYVIMLKKPVTDRGK